MSNPTRDSATFVLLGLLAVVVVVSIAVFTGTVIGGERLTIDADNPLTNDRHVREFAEQDKTSADFRQVDMTVTVAATHDAVGLDGLHTDYDNTWVRIQYREEIERTVRFYVPEGYFEPRIHEDIEPEQGNAAISLDPAEDRNYTAVTIHVTGPTDVVFPVSKEAGAVSAGRYWVRDKIEDGTQRELPELADTGEWQYVDDQLRGDNATVALPDGEYTVQYQPADDNESWLTVPPCDRELTPVCQTTKNGTTYLLSVESNPPEIRYRKAAGGLMPSVPDLGAAWDELASIPGDLLDDVGSLLSLTTASGSGVEVMPDA
jgi:hypothetical protein